MEQKINLLPFFLELATDGCDCSNTESLAPGEEYKIVLEISKFCVTPFGTFKSHVVHSDGGFTEILPETRILPFGRLKKEIIVSAGSKEGVEKITTSYHRLLLRECVCSRTVKVAATVATTPKPTFFKKPQRKPVKEVRADKMRTDTQQQSAKKPKKKEDGINIVP